MKAIKLQPNTGAVKYLNMAQLSAGEESISFYQKALGILLNEKAQMERNPQVFILFYSFFNFIIFINFFSIHLSFIKTIYTLYKRIQNYLMKMRDNNFFKI